ncbi:hypothetical protein U9M48_038829, partial [Paspalum notatum var. saurae]
MFQIQKKILGVLHNWDRNVLGELQRRISKVKKDLERCRRSQINQENISREHVLRYKLERLQDQHHTYWKQRAHTAWLTKGDRNTRFFHASASERKRRNYIKSLKGDDGDVVAGMRLKPFITDHYKNLFSSSAGQITEEVLSCMERRVSRVMNETLLRTFTGEEVEEALRCIGDLKAPGPDGIPSVFYKRFWSLVGDQVKKEVLAVLNGGPMPQGASGQKINKDKTSIMFSPNAPTHVRDHVLRVLGIDHTAKNKKYLGLPVYIGKSKKSMLARELFSKAGKEIMIKAVAQAIPTYAMSCFDLTKETRRVITPRGSSILQKVSELINPITENWDEQLVRDTFCIEDANIILSLPISAQRPDFLAWHPDPKGTFSVKSAYVLGTKIKSHQNQKDASTSSSEEGGFNWGKIWRLDLPANKVKMDVKLNIARRGVDLDTICPMCSRFDEDPVQGGKAWLAVIKYGGQKNYLDGRKFTQGSRWWGFVIRNHLGMVIAAGAGSANILLTALHAEAIACLKRLELAADLGMRHIILETDAAVLTEALSNASVD